MWPFNGKPKPRVLIFPKEHLENLFKNWDAFVDAKTERTTKKYLFWEFVERHLPETSGGAWRFDQNKHNGEFTEIL